MADPIPYTEIDLVIAAKTLWGECRGEPENGQVAVGWVIRNRAAWRPHSWWGWTPSDVCLKSEQFSCWNEGSVELPAMNGLRDGEPLYVSLKALAKSVFDGEVDDPTKGSTQYQRVGTGAWWSKNLEIAVLIGKHEFYRLTPDGKAF